MKREKIINKLIRRLKAQLENGDDYTCENCDLKPLDGTDDFWGASIFQVSLSLKRKDERLKYELIGKFLQENELSRYTFQSEKRFCNEQFFYSNIVPDILSVINDNWIRRKYQSLFPKCYYASLIDCVGVSDIDDCGVITENLNLLGFKHSNGPMLDLDHLKLAISRLGFFHGVSFFMKEKHADTFYSRIIDPLEEVEYFSEFEDAVEAMYSRFPGSLDSIKREFGKENEFVMKLEEASHEKLKTLQRLVTPCEPLAVLCHGDFVHTNLLFKYDENGSPIEMKIIDFQTVRYASPAIDLATILFNNCSPYLLVRHFDILMKEYQKAVVSTLDALLEDSSDSTKSRYSLGSFYEDFRLHALYGYFITSKFAVAQLSDAHEVAELCRTVREKPFSSEHANIMSNMGGSEVTETITSVAKFLIEKEFL